jgi:hypothetical protein
MSAVTVEAPLPALPGQDAYGYGAARVEQRQHAARAQELAAIDAMFADLTSIALDTLRNEARLQETLFWGRVRTACLTVAVGPGRTLTSTTGEPVEPVLAALVEELALYGAELAAQPYRRASALAELDEAWVTGRRAYLEKSAT